jgi:Secretion system C-terminal sorting domain
MNLRFVPKTILFFGLLISNLTFAQNTTPPPATKWTRTIAGGNIQATSDGGFLALNSANFQKYDASGVLQWTVNTPAIEIEEISGGGFAVLAQSSGNILSFMGYVGGIDSWVFTVNSGGVVQWFKNLGGALTDSAGGLEVLSNGDIGVSVVSNSSTGNYAGGKGAIDTWVFKYNSAGTLLWKRANGGTSDDEASLLKKDSGDRLILAGATKSSNGDLASTGTRALKDIWVMSLASNGASFISKAYIGNGDDFATGLDFGGGSVYVLASNQSTTGSFPLSAGRTLENVVLKFDTSLNPPTTKNLFINGNGTFSQFFAADGGGVVLGSNSGASPNFTVSGSAFVAKLDASLNTSWAKDFGGISGLTSTSKTSSDGVLATYYSGSNYTTAKLSSAGLIEWTFPKNGLFATNAKQTPDGGYLVARNSGTSGFSEVIRLCPTPMPNVTSALSQPVCDGGSVTLTSATKTGFTLQWQKNGVNIAGETSANYLAMSPATLAITDVYNVVYTDASCGGSGNSDNISVFIQSGILTTPTITVTGNLSFCDGDSVKFQAVSTCRVTTYQWKKDNVNIAGATTATYYAKQSGVYTVTITGNAATQTSAGITTVVTLPNPQISAGSAISFCDGGSVVLTTNVASGCSVTAYQWKRNGVDISGATARTYTANQSGVYTVSVKTGSNTTVVSATGVTVTVTLSTPTIISSNGTVFCAGGSTTLSVNPNGCNLIAYEWILNGTKIPGATGGSIVVNSTGNYSVYVTGSTGNAATSPVLTVTVNPNPSANAGNAVSLTGKQLYSPTNVQVASGGTAPYQYLWTTNFPINIDNPNIATPQIGTFNQSIFANVKVTDINGCIANSSVLITYIPCTITATSNGNNYFCFGDSTKVLAEVANDNGGLKYQWKKDNANVSGTSNIFYVKQTGRYTFFVEDKFGCEKTSNEILITENFALIASAGAGASLTGTEKYDLSKVNTSLGGTPPFTFVWTATPDVTGNNSTNSFPVFGPFTVNTAIKLQLTDSKGCKANATANIVYIPCTITASARGVASFCTGDSTIIDAVSTNGNLPLAYTWNFNTASLGIPSSRIKLSETGKVDLKIEDAKGCVATSSLSITKNPNPVVVVDGKSVYCFNEATKLTAKPTRGSAPYAYTWVFENALVGSDSTFSAKRNGFYLVRVRDAKGCVAESPNFSVSGKAQLVATVTPVGTTTVYAPFGVTLNANQDANLGYQWKKDDKDISGATLASYEAKETGSYVVKISDKDGCTATSAPLAIKIEIPTGVDPSLESFEISFAPNPTSGMLRVKIILPQGSPVNITMHDLLGKSTGEWNSPQNTREHTFEIDLSQKPTGSYWLRANANTGQVVRKVIKE